MPHASRDPKILKDMNLENEDFFELIKNPPEVGAIRIFEQPELWDSTIDLTQAVTTQVHLRPHGQLILISVNSLLVLYFPVIFFIPFDTVFENFILLANIPPVIPHVLFQVFLLH